MTAKMQGREWLFLLLLTGAAVVIHGYHIGSEDQAIYLPAIKKLLDPGLYPHDSQFFLAQSRPTLFDELIVFSVRATRVRLDSVLFFWHLLSVFLMLLGCWKLSRRCFAEPCAQWAAVATVAALLTLPVAGTALYFMDEYLHPRGLATPALLFAFVAVLDRRPSGLGWIVLAALVHPTMTLYGIFHLLFQVRKAPLAHLRLLFPLGLFKESTNQAWRDAVSTKDYLYPLRWHWYEWVGVFGPIALLGFFARFGRRNGMAVVEHISSRLFASAILGIAGAVLITSVRPLQALVRWEPMRVLHLVYIILFLLAGGLAGKFLLFSRPLRWAILFVPLAMAMCYGQLRVYPSSPHIEWPGRVPKNDWVLAFDWVRQNTSRDALFALDPHYMERSREDFHGFRALAERSMLADYVKDRAVVVLFPDLASAWREQVRDREGWSHFGAEDFRQLQRKYGVNWVLLERPGAAGLPCPYENRTVMVCLIE